MDAKNPSLQNPRASIPSLRPKKRKKKKKRIQTPHREIRPYETDGHPLTEEQLPAVNYRWEAEQAIKTVPAPVRWRHQRVERTGSGSRISTHQVADSTQRVIGVVERVRELVHPIVGLAVAIETHSDGRTGENNR